MRIIDADNLEIDYIVASTTTNTECYRYVSKEQIDNAPTVDAEPVRHGHWVKSPEYRGDNISGYTDNHWVCSECGKEAIVNEWYMYDLTDYCPNCGAKMNKE